MIASPLLTLKPDMHQQEVLCGGPELLSIFAHRQIVVCRPLTSAGGGTVSETGSPCPFRMRPHSAFAFFYQPDEATSPSNRLKNFLKLKALASPGRQDNFTTERILGTGETICMIASGKNSDFPPRHTSPERPGMAYDTISGRDG